MTHIIKRLLLSTRSSDAVSDQKSLTTHKHARDVWYCVVRDSIMITALKMRCSLTTQHQSNVTWLQIRISHIFDLYIIGKRIRFPIKAMVELLLCYELKTC